MKAFNDLLDILEGDPDLEETPVDVKTFVEKILNQPQLSDLQYTMVEFMSQIYKRDTLERSLGVVEGSRHYHKFTKGEIILQLGKGCHAAGTPVFNATTGSWTKIDSLVNDNLICSMDGKIHSATPVFLEGYGKLVKVRTSLGFEETVYIGHKYFSYLKKDFYKRKGAEWQQINNLNIGDRIAIALNYGPTDSTPIPLEHAELIGYWLGDGCLPTDKNRLLNIDFNVDEHESIARYLELCDFIKDKPQKINHKQKHMVSFRHHKQSNALKLVQEYGLWGLRSHDKFIPDAVWKSNNNVLAAMISKLWQTDGCVYIKNGATAEYVTVSSQLAIDVHRALLRLGIPASKRSRLPKSNFKNASIAWYITVSSQECFNEFVQKIILLDHKRHNLLDKSGRVYKRIIDGIYYDRIVAIEPVGDGNYYTITVPDTHNYIGNGFVSSNSGKDYTSTIAVAYIVYKLLCLKDPSRYYGKPSGDPIDIINIAINAQQARTVFFNRFKSIIDRAEWFNGKYDAKRDYIDFDKHIAVYSGHSERESHEGLNLLIAVLDEISGFSLESVSETGKTAQNIYDMFRGSVDSRFPELGKVVLLSFPRFDGDFITQHYDNVIASKEVVQYEHTFILDETLPSIESNMFTINWEEDEIQAYAVPKVFALKKPTWKVNPTIDLDALKGAFYRNPADALSRFACMPVSIEGSFFRYPDKLRAAFYLPNPINGRRSISAGWKPDLNREYFMHVDLSQKVDKCAIAVSYVDHWERVKLGGIERSISPHIVTEMVAFWEPQREGPVDFKDVKEWILDFRRRGAYIKMCTFDRWNSFDLIQELIKNSIPTEVLSVGKQHYEDFALILYEERYSGPALDDIVHEMLALRVIKNKVDHPRTGYKDLSDAVVGSVYNTIRLAKRSNAIIEVYDMKDKPKRVRPEEPIDEAPKPAEHVIEWLQAMRVL